MAKQTKAAAKPQGAGRLRLADITPLDREALVTEVIQAALEVSGPFGGLGDVLSEADDVRALADMLGVPYLSIELARSTAMLDRADIEEWNEFRQHEHDEGEVA